MMRDRVGMITHERKTATRRGSALLVCTLAAAVLSMAAIAILRSSQRNIARVDSLRSSTQGRSVSQGLFQRSVAVLRTNPAASGLVTDPGVVLPGARSQLTRLSPSATRIQVYLYAGASMPAIDTVVDPSVL